MPGPCNVKKKQKSQAKKGKKRTQGRQSLNSQSCEPSPSFATDDQEDHCSLNIHGTTPPNNHASPFIAKEIDSGIHGEVVLQTPYIHDPGNGPRVKNTRTFLTSYFAQPPSLDEPLCAEFAQEEVLQMLCTVLPEETALVRPSLSQCNLSLTYPLWNRYCGTTRAGQLDEYARLVSDCTAWAMFYPIT